MLTLACCVASVTAIWPFWIVYDDGVRVKCGTPSSAIGLDYADGRCRTGGQRRLLAAGAILVIGADAAALVRRRAHASVARRPR